MRTASACDTPVYRYAMYRWQPGPYEVYHFHREKLDSAAEGVRGRIGQVGEKDEVRANVMFLPVDVAKEADLKRLPPDVKEAWEKREEKSVPHYLISSPRARHLFQGLLDEKEIAALVDSPARQQLGKLLQEGKAGVYVLIPGADEKATGEAEQVVRGVLSDVASGKIMTYTPPAMDRSGGQEDEGEPAAPRTELGLLKVSREDAAEQWFVKTLLSLEPDLVDSKEPLLFLIFGRGRALFSCLGKGIYADNLIQDIDYITGACSCMVKEQNPGMDILMRYDWDAVAESLMRKFGAEEGSGYMYGGDTLFPELAMPGKDDPVAADPQGESTETGSVPGTDKPAPADASSTADTAIAVAQGATDLSTRPADAAGQGAETGAATSPAEAAETPPAPDSAAPAPTARDQSDPVEQVATVSPKATAPAGA
ncbi:MAG: hypothetical protein FJ276_23445, partial [Planctomycetes bacterium]|nr:hypothetical protein [Planctomycetota bacterium]